LRLWQAVSEAIIHGDETTATNEKFLVEEEQRRGSRERKAKMEEWMPRFFDRNLITGDWVYKYSEYVLLSEYFLSVVM
jgi:oxysterol-binding protein-related protein 8